MKMIRWSTAVLLALLWMSLPGHELAQVFAQSKPTLTAKLVDPEKKAAERAATVEVTVSGVELVDPSLSNEKPVTGQGHLHYQLDKGPVIATPSPKLSFHELTAGTHTIVVILAGNDHKSLGAQQQVTVTVPSGPTSTSGAPASKSKAGY